MDNPHECQGNLLVEELPASGWPEVAPVILSEAKDLCVSLARSFVSLRMTGCLSKVCLLPSPMYKCVPMRYNLIHQQMLRHDAALRETSVLRPPI